jgi:hypothetical protein
VEIKKSVDILKDAKINTLSIGDSGKGKTHFVGTICDHGNPFVIDSEGGVTTIANKRFDYVKVNTWSEFKEALNWFMINREKNKETGEVTGYTHLVIDSITRLQNYLVKEIVGDDIKNPTMNQWGDVLAHMRVLLDKLTKQCPVPIHMTAMAMEAKDDITGQVKIYPNLQGSIRYDLAGYFDVVLYHDCGEKDGDQVYWVQTKGDQRTVAKSRLDCIQKLNKYERNSYDIIANIFKQEKVA